MSALWTRLAPGRSAGDAANVGGESKASDPPVPSASGRLVAANVPVMAGPAARSGHAMTLLPPTDSVLLFGGADGRVFYDDFYVLEPSHYADGSGREGQAAESLALGWKKLMVMHAPARHASLCVSNSQLSSVSSGSSPAASRHRSSLVEPLHAGAGRDYHSMHYVPQPPAEEQACGMRVLVVGNVVIAAEQRVGNSDSGSALAFEMQELRVEEVRVRQATLEAQWVPRRIDSMYKPRARHAHSSALIHGQQLFVFGGKSATSSAYFNDLFFFDVTINQWRKPAVAGPAPAARAFASLAASDEHDKLFLYGGTDGRETFGSLFIYDVRLSRWDALAGGRVSGDRPACRVGHSLTFVAPHHLVVFGGRQRAKRQNQLFMFNMLKREWCHVSGRSSSSNQGEEDDEELPVGRTAHAALLYDVRKTRPRIESSSTSQRDSERGRLIVFGGYAGSHRWLDDLYLVTLPSSVELTQSVSDKTASQQQQQQQSQSQSQQRRSDKGSRLAMSGAFFDATASQSQVEKPVVTHTAEPKTPAKTLLPHQTQQSQRQQSNENNEEEVSVVSRPLAQSQPSVRGSSSSSSSVRCESQNSGSGSGSSSGNGNSSGGGGVLSDITNQTPNSPRPPSSQTGVSKPNANTSMSSSLSSISTSPFKSNKRRRLDESSQCQPLVAGQEAGTHSGSSSSDSTVVNVGLQTTLIQVLQRQSELEQGLVRIESMLATQQPPNTRHHHQYPLPSEREASKSLWPQGNTPTTVPSSSPCLDAYVRAQNEALESRLESLRRKYEALEDTLKRTESEKSKLREQLVARETELYEAKRNLESNFPPLSDRVRAVEDASRAQLATAQVIESKISAVHDILDELRHAGGEGTEAEDSPEKRDRIGSSPGMDAPSSSPPLFYPQRFVLGLEERLRASNAERDALHQQLAEAQAKLARAEEKEEHMRRFFSSWFSQEPLPSSSSPAPSLTMPNR